VAGLAQEDEYAAYLKAKSAFDSGDYVTAAARFDALLERTPSNPALAVECHKYAGVAFLFIGDEDRSRRNFYNLLSLSPDYALDPLLFPIEVVDFFISVKSSNAERLEELRRAKALEETRRRQAEEAKKQAELAKLAKTFYIQRAEQSRSLLVALMPLGAGQFQNGHKVKGGLFLAAEALLIAAATTSYALHESLRREASSPIAEDSVLHDLENRELASRAVNQACLFTLGGVLIAGVIDALYYYRPNVVTWRQIEEKDIPDGLLHRQGTSISSPKKGPKISLELKGMGLRGRF
jgi:hypothetical protein